MASPLGRIATYAPGRLRSLVEDARGSRRGIADVLLSLLPQGVTAASGLAVTLILARGLSAASLGRHALAISVASLVIAFTDLGIGATAVRFAAGARAEGRMAEARAILRWTLGLRLLVGVGASAAAFALAPAIAALAWHDSTLAPLIRLALLTSALAPLVTFPALYLQAHRRFRLNAFAASGQGAFTLLAVLVAAGLGLWSVEAILVASAVGMAVAAAVLLPLVPWEVIRPRLPHRRALSMPASEGLGTFARYNLAASLVCAVTARMDVWAMGFFLGDAEIGVYTVASRFTLPLLMLIAAVNTALAPRAAAVAGSREETVRLLRKTFALSALLAFGALVYSLVVPMAAPWIFGEAYEGSVALARLLGVRYVIAILFCPIAVVGYNFDLIRSYVAMNVAQLVLVTGANALLLPRIGADGAAISFIASELLGFAVIALLIRSRLRADRRPSPAAG
ncbi:MAG TPA: oligosaccharide flippase family protein [Vulgatibacter sp.]|nr:oligosaccharide flippase family protein [Vulgatibacter sp.]